MVHVTAVILAGGKGQRMGGVDKAELSINGVTFWEMVVRRLRDVADEFVITGEAAPLWMQGVENCNFIPDYQINGKKIGPLGGMIAGLRYVRAGRGDQAIMVTAPVDVPLFPENLAQALIDRIDLSNAACVAYSQSRLQPTFGAWRGSLAAQMEVYAQGGRFSLHGLAEELEANCLKIDSEPAAFSNINSHEDLKRLESSQGYRFLV